MLLAITTSVAVAVRFDRQHVARTHEALTAVGGLDTPARATLRDLADDERAVRRLDAFLLGTNALLVLAVLAWLVRVPVGGASADDAPAVTATSADRGPDLLPPAVPAANGARDDDALLQSLASICDMVTRTDTASRLSAALSEVAATVPAKGIVVWAAPSGSGDLRAVLTHGYPADLVARLPLVPRSSDNATARACRTGSLQIVRAKVGEATGALVAPLISAHGCVGCLAVEVKGGVETADRACRIVEIVAAAIAGRFGDAGALASTGGGAHDVRSA